MCEACNNMPAALLVKQPDLIFIKSIATYRVYHAHVIVFCPFQLYVDLYSARLESAVMDI